MKKLIQILALLLLVQIVSLGSGFAMGEGWMRYPAISPDGKQIVFSALGDIFLVSSEGGNAQPITTHAAHDYHPVWSPNGKWIAYASDRYGNFDVFVVELATGTTTRLTFHSGSDIPTSFSPDGSRIYFESTRFPGRKSAYFPYRRFKQLYSIEVSGGQPTMEMTIPLEEAAVSGDGNSILYQDYKGYEDIWRKHHESSVTRDLWVHDKKANTYIRLTTFAGEDRNPVWGKENKFYYLSESKGTFNVFESSVSDPNKATQLTSYKTHPVRFLSVSTNGTLCYGYNGAIYTMKSGGKGEEVAINILASNKENDRITKKISGAVSEMEVSKDGKEIAFIARGEVFVTAVENGITKRITNTPEQERSVSFSPDGKKLLYASEREGSWNLYETSRVQEDEAYFFVSTLLKEEQLLSNGKETFQPAYSPDGKEVAFLEERTTLRVINLESKKVRTVLSGLWNYSYSDGDQWFEWSPDSKWLAVHFIDRGRWMDEVGLVNATGQEKVVNLTNSGYSDSQPKWMMGGKALIWFGDRYGMRSHGSWGAQSDAFGMFLTQDAWDEYKLTEDEYKLKKELEEKAKEEKEKDSKEEKKADDKEEVVEPIKIELEDLEDRFARLTIHSSSLADAVMDKDGSKLYYLSSFEKGHDLWVSNLRKRETKVLCKMEKRGGSLFIDKEEKFLIVLNGGSIYKVNTESGEKKPVTFSAEMELRPAAEREYFFEHIWRQAKAKFYLEDLHGVDWSGLKGDYAAKLNHINNHYDFAELMSELLGELNGSHTGCRYFHREPTGDQTAYLGGFYSDEYSGNGLKIEEIVDKSPLKKARIGVKEGHIIERIDGVTITPETNYHALLNRKAGKYVLLSLKDPESEKTWEGMVKPISAGGMSNLLYERWVEARREIVEKLSNGTLGYVHVRGMDDGSFRKVYEDALGRFVDRKGLIVDTRFNGGGWLHDDLATFLSGKKYVELVPRGQKIGAEPLGKWTQPSVVLAGEGNYSDAHFFPYVYKALGIGKLIGMPVPGTATAVWWERLHDGELVFGIPQVGVRGMDGKFLENQQLEPDIKIANEPAQASEGKDQQLERAVQELMK